MDCRHLDEYYELCLLGAIGDNACADIRAHVERGCPHCLARLREAAHIVYLLSRTTRAARPDPKLKSRLLRRLRKK